MTSRAVLNSLHSIRFHRALFNGRRFRFLDSVAFYAGRQRSHDRFRKATYQTSSQKTIFHAFATHTFLCSKSIVDLDVEYNVEIISGGRPFNNKASSDITTFTTNLQEDAMLALKELFSWHRTDASLYLNKEVVELTVILSDDRHIQDLNRQYLNEDRPTDVLSFPMDGGEDDVLPTMLLGDIVISVDTARRQAEEMGHSLRTECRILLVHALLHLFGYDHDKSDEDWERMAELEKETLTKLGWHGIGLISSTERFMTMDDDDSPPPVTTPKRADVRIRNGTNLAPSSKKSEASKTNNETDLSEDESVKLVALDLDGTLLTSHNLIKNEAKEAIEEAIHRGIRVVVATGKARPAAISVCQKFGLYGKQSLLSHQSPGIFLQGIIVHTVTGEPLSGPSLPSEIVRSAFDYATKNELSCVAFLGDENVTLKRTPELVDLHEKYYEPLAKVVRSVDQIVGGPPVKKILFMSTPEVIQNELTPIWDTKLKGTDAETTKAVSTMLELIPKGTNKWVGLQSLLKSMDLTARSCMAVGDGLNDYEMINNVALGIAMGNAVESVKSVADYVVSSNDDDGIVEAFHKLFQFNKTLDD